MKFLHLKLLTLLLIFTVVDVWGGVVVGDHVCVQEKRFGWWFAADVIKIVENNEVKVHYVDYGYDGWVTSDRYWLPEESYEIGDKVWWQWRGIWYSSEVVEVSSDQYKVHYLGDGDEHGGDEWVDRCLLKPAPSVGDPLWVKPGLSDWAYGKLIATESINLWKVHVGGYTYTDPVEWREFDDKLGVGQILLPTPQEVEEIQNAFLKNQPSPMPQSIQRFDYKPVAQPIVSNTPSETKPIGVGGAATGGGYLDLKIALPVFEEPGDIYFGVGHDSWDILLYGQDGGWSSINAGLKPFKKNYYSYLGHGLQYTFLHEFDLSTVPEGEYQFYLLFAPVDHLDSYYLWSTEISTKRTGQITGQPLQCGDEIQLSSLISAMEEKGDKAWYDKVREYVDEYTDDEGAASPQDAYYEITLAAYMADNVYPYCWAALSSVQNAPNDPLALNSAATCLYELEEIELAGQLLDCAVSADPEFPLNWDNAAYYHDQKGDIDAAIDAKMKNFTQDGDPTPHSAWDGYNYAQSKGRSEAATLFNQHLPSNYELLHNDGSAGIGAATLKVCCGCNDKMFNSVTECTESCSASLSCFTNICTTNQMCCGLNGAFGIEAGLCYPPVGINACAEVDSDGNFTVKAGANAILLEAYVGASTNFRNNHNVFAEGKAFSQKVKAIILTSNPKEQRIGSTYSPAKDWTKKAFGKRFGVSVGANLSHAKWLRSMLCMASANK